MNISSLFISRPVGTTLLAIGMMMLGLVAYRFLPVASLPAVDLPTIRVTASRPGADPESMASSVAAPLERHLGAIAGVTEMTSTSGLGTTNIFLQFDLSRNVDSAAQDVQAAINAAVGDLPSDLPSLPSMRKANPAASPILTLALTSDTIPASAIYDAADSVVVQRISQVEGVGDVSVSGADQPAVRVRLNPDRLAAIGLSADDVRTAIVNGNALAPIGAIDGSQAFYALSVNAQLITPEDYGQLVIHASDGIAVRLADIATVEPGVRNRRSDAWFNGKPAVLLNITKAADANVMSTVDAVKALIPEVKQLIPAGIEIDILNDRTKTIHASVEDMQFTLLATVALVMAVVFVFLRRLVPTLAAGLTVPLSFAGAFAAMWLTGLSIDNLSLMALAVASGFVVDDAIVMIETIYANIEKGMKPLEAAHAGARQIGFTVIAISISLMAAFIPLFFMGGIVGKFFLTFSLTLAFTIAVSTVVSLTLTPMICGHRIKARDLDARQGRFDRAIEHSLERTVAFYDRTLKGVLHHRFLAVVITIACIVLTGFLYAKVPKGFMPRDDTGFVMGNSQAASDISYPAMLALQKRALAIVERDPAVQSIGASVGGGFLGTANRGQMLIALKAPDEREATDVVIERLRRAVAVIPGLDTSFFSPSDIRVGARTSDSEFQFTLWDADYDELVSWAPRILARLRQEPLLTDVNSDRQPSGLQANVVVDRTAASRLGVKMTAVDAALNNAFAQRQVTIVYGERNQYRVILETYLDFAKDPEHVLKIYVPGNSGTQVPLSAFARIERTLAPIGVNHQGQFPAVTISYNIGPETTLSEANDAVKAAVAGMHLPDTLHAEFAGDAANASSSSGGQPLLILAALLAVYIVLGILYESLIHPLTIISTLPSAGLGALLALWISGTELTIVAFIGIILLIGIVKKNGIMLVDFALEAERQHGMSPQDAIHEACLRRFRPIMMTTLAAFMGALPLVLATGPGADLHRPLGVTIIGGLIVSQALTLYTTPIIYLIFARLSARFGAKTKAGKSLDHRPAV
ncbi:efflux RND transporter permease subunit [Agrobacterium vitis]|uniref:efflux RND transporter permease subunit n=1 Tax=Agrobacterium vitis TaxID=373 RepID=UPI0012E7BB05|nr:efflux RND transporter permease subunit [Agrobacterium vitis]MVA49206.1 acriflavine resistance protein B [Agrobacterium vitis]NSZ54813.1 acriflavine resistance protein B [Agrobacterium vitis]NTA33805.1 acriflavine resistance protein B [Agrobacterium vitis]